ncbi:MAG: hypothetical protein AAFV27_09850 [Pseudomonadota bacterium]
MPVFVLILGLMADASTVPLQQPCTFDLALFEDLRRSRTPVR